MKLPWTNDQWTCPHCWRDSIIVLGTIITVGPVRSLRAIGESGDLSIEGRLVCCPNGECRRSVLYLEMTEHPRHGSHVLLKTWMQYPENFGKPMPDYVPKSIRDNYREANLVLESSAKASATLARRALQGIIRDFWQVKPGRLIDEIAQIKNKTDGETYGAIDATRKIGNIGAHMENDVNLIIDVEPEEARALLRLIELLIKEWYVNRHERAVLLKGITEAAEQKKRQQKP